MLRRVRSFDCVRFGYWGSIGWCWLTEIAVVGCMGIVDLGGDGAADYRSNCEKKCVEMLLPAEARVFAAADS